MNTPLKIFYLLVGLGLGAYLSVLSQFYFKTDVAILTHFAERMLSGAPMSEAYYEVNPPMSMIIYIPVIWMKHLLKLTMYDAHMIYVQMLTLISLGMTWGLLKRLPFPEIKQKHFIFGLLVIGLIMVPNFSFGDREHIIMLGLIPFMLVQAALHLRADIPKSLSIPALVFGTIGIMVKPHYGLIPTVLMLWRFWSHKDCRFYKAPDFLALALGVIAYGVVLFTLFPDYLNIIMPDVIALYLPHTNPYVVQEMFVFGFVTACISVTALTFDITREQKTIIKWLMAVTFLLFVPYLVQGKGFDYHRIPWMLSFSALIGMIAYSLIGKHAHGTVTNIISTMLVIGMIWALRPLPFERPTHREFRQLPLSQLIEKECPKPCSFLLLNDTSELIHQLAIYHDATHASRFTSMWYMLPLIQHEKSLRDGGDGVLPDEEYKALKAKYTDMVAQDLLDYQPDMIIELETLRVGDPEFDFIDFYKSNPKFEDAFSAYETSDTQVLDLSLYFLGLSTKHLESLKTSELTIYKRKEN
jgi:hypothetical protein